MGICRLQNSHKSIEPAHKVANAHTGRHEGHLSLDFTPAPQPWGLVQNCNAVDKGHGYRGGMWKCFHWDLNELLTGFCLLTVQ